jgi:hypothetical protein
VVSAVFRGRSNSVVKTIVEPQNPCRAEQDSVSLGVMLNPQAEIFRITE